METLEISEPPLPIQESLLEFERTPLEDIAVVEG